MWASCGQEESATIDALGNVSIRWAKRCHTVSKLRTCLRLCYEYTHSFIIIGTIVYVEYCEIDICLKLLDESHPIIISADSQPFASFSEENEYEEVPTSQGLALMSAASTVPHATRSPGYLNPKISDRSRNDCKIRANACFSRIARLELDADDTASFTRDSGILVGYCNQIEEDVL